ncbi:DUF4003 family protein [Clostridium baratii]|uniref:DUF4003 family protein n=1 Tax=Clostridium baratii TaxID=1561 RepID=UPI0028FE3F7A|nr:DUF4003 family protein [Clostridium baratii]MDU1055090.1 DUF4003 family protein [Clostridium baratii]
MDIELKEKVRIFSEVNNDFRKNFRWDGKEINCLASLITGSSLEGFDEKNMKAIRKFIRKNTKFNSEYRGEFLKVFSILMNLRKDYEEVFENTKYVYSVFMERDFSKCKEALYAAFLLAKRFSGKELEDKLNELLNIKENIDKYSYDFFKKNDYIMYVYLTIMGREFDEILEIIKNIDLKFKNLNLKEFKEPSAFYISLLNSNLEIDEKIERALNIRCCLVDNVDVLDDDVYPLIGLASNFVKDEEIYSKGVLGIYNMLSDKEHFNSKGLSDKILFKISLCIVLMRYIEYIYGDIIDLDTEGERELIYLIEEYIAFAIIF